MAASMCNPRFAKTLDVDECYSDEMVRTYVFLVVVQTICSIVGRFYEYVSVH